MTGKDKTKIVVLAFLDLNEGCYSAEMIENEPQTPREPQTVPGITREIRNLRRQIDRLKERRTNSPEGAEAREAVAMGIRNMALDFVEFVGGEIEKRQLRIRELEQRRESLKSQKSSTEH